ncbi:peptide-methionine (S)-S-oxide reductase MsrA [Enterococcus sp. LJL51]|uniref:peptide-methionine (S)-S-oxide reductase MsrA n=1 Tax=Enterococcus sp. LJL51 TaxID=3416656 RepID=UPI003CFB469B
MEASQEELISDIYNLIVNPGTREWERSLLVAAKNSIEDTANLKNQLDKLEGELRPLALRNNLTPDVADFYLKITGESVIHENGIPLKHLEVDQAYQERAIFAGGCFWCMVEPFEKKPGVISILSGYTGGTVSHPTYDQVHGGYTGHVEAVEIIFDTRLISYQSLIDLYWQITDPTDALGQFQDRGSQYRPVIFVQDEAQRKIAEQSKQSLSDSGRYQKPIITEIKPAATFWPAENYHQEFYKKQPKRYKRIKRARNQFLRYQQLKSRLRIRREAKNKTGHD